MVVDKQENPNVIVPSYFRVQQNGGGDDDGQKSAKFHCFPHSPQVSCRAADREKDMLSRTAEEEQKKSYFRMQIGECSLKLISRHNPPR